MKSQEEAYLNFFDQSKFIGYQFLQSESKVIKVFTEGIVLDQTPFYATSGGQVADQGTINGMKVIDVSKLPNGQFLHVVEGEFEEGDEVLAIVDAKERLKTIRNHSAAHLFHQSIKEIFGKHANQQGSQVSPKSWRFDFNHYETEPDQKILEIEALVKTYIIDHPLDVIIRELPIEEARKIGAMALFGEKYGDIVRVVDMGWSKEFCGGTHVKNTKEIIDFAIISYESIGSGIYRMEGVTGTDVKEQVKGYLEPYYLEIESLIDKATRLSKTLVIPAIPKRLGSYQDIMNLRHFSLLLKEMIKTEEKEINRIKQQDVLTRLDDFITDHQSKNQVIITHDLDVKVLKQLMDALYDKIKAETLFIVNIFEGKATFLCKSSKDQANLLVKLASDLTQGSGGGKPNLAQGGTQDLSHLDLAIEAIKRKL
jgi:alanyl-tRNA synthetase